MKLVICSSAAFYKHVCEIADKLEALGVEVVIPKTAHIMRSSGDFNVENYKTWYKNNQDFHKKKALMDGHFEEVASGDAILVVNDEKHGVPGYIGPNVLMEIAIAYYLKKPIFLLEDIDPKSPVYEEILGMEAVRLGGYINKLATNLN
jgi:hypothetical protein